MQRVTPMPLSDADNRRFLAAQGWFGLGNLTEATAELERIDPQSRAHPEVLELRVAIFLSAKHWQSAFEVADSLVRLAPHRLRGWLARSETLHGLGRTREAAQQLGLAMGTEHSGRWEVKYALAQYACQEQRFKAAYAFLKDALDTAESPDLRLKALDDPLLEPLWARIRSVDE